AGGILNLGTNGAVLPAGTNIVFSGGVLQYSAANQIDYSAQIVNSGSAIAIGLNGQVVTFASPLAASNTGGLTVQSALPGGDLILSAANIYSGTTTLVGGTVTLNNAAALPAGSNIKFSGGVLQFTATNTNDYSASIASSGSAIAIGLNGQIVTFASPLAASNTGGLTVLSSVPGGDLILTAANLYTGTTTISSGTLQLGVGVSGSDGTILGSSAIVDNSALIYDRVGNYTYSGTISGTGSILVIGSGTQVFTGTNTFTGSTTIAVGSTLQLGIGISGSDGTAGSSPGILDNGLLIYDRFASGTFSGTISGAGNLLMEGSGTEVLTGNNTLSGSTFIAGGATLQLGNNTVGNDGNLNSSLNIQDNGTLAFLRSGSNSYSGTISGTGGVTMSGIGIQVISGVSNTYGGTTGLNGGVLLVAGPGSLGTQGFAGLVMNGGTIGFISGTNTIAINLTLNGTASGFITENATDNLLLTGTLSGTNINFTGSGTNIVSGILAGSGTNPLALGDTGAGTTLISGSIAVGSANVTKSGAGLMVITGSNNYTGTTTVAQGPLAFGSGGALAPNAAVVLGQGATTGQLVLGYVGGPANLTIGSLTGTLAGDAVVGGNATTGTLTINNTSTTGSFGGVFGGAGTNQNNLAVVITGGGNLLLTSASPMTGGLTVESGTVTTGAVADLGAVATRVTLGDANTGTSNAVISFTGAGNTFQDIIQTTSTAVSGSLIISATGGSTFSGTFVLNNNNINLNLMPTGTATGQAYQIGAANTGVLSGTGNLIVNASGQIVNFLGTSAGNAMGNFVGSLVINSGTLRNDQGSQDPYTDTMTIVVNSGASWGHSGAGLGNSADVIAGFQDGSNGGGSVWINRNIVSGGTGNYTFGGTIVQQNSGKTWTKEGQGTQTISGSVNTDTGNLIVQAGTFGLSGPANTGTNGAYSLTVGTLSIATGNSFGTGALTGNTLIVQTSGNTTLAVTGNYLVTGNILVNGGNGTTTTQGTLTMVDGQINTLTINNTTTNATALKFTAGSILDMEVGSASDEIVLLNSEQLTTTGSVQVNITGLTGINGTNQTLIYAPGSSTFTIGSGGFFLNGVSGNLGGNTFSLASPGGGILQLVETPNTVSGTVYWSGTQGNGTWNSFSGGTTNYSNWATTPDGLTDAHAGPGPANDVVFSGSNATIFNTVLGQNRSIQGLFFSNVGGAVTIGGTNTLTVGADGINVLAGAAAPTISSTLATSGNQVWSLNDPTTAPLTVNGSIIEANNITTSGGGELLLGGSNAFSGTFAIGGSTVVQLGNANALNMTATGALAFAAGSTGTLNLGGFSVTANGLSTNSGTVGSPVIQNNAVAPSTLTINDVTNSTYAGAIQDGTAGSGALSIIKTGT
ncbi:MAG TPA: autotransporter-associated beta strand repeat-containing protein, partial [Verrucomicrobiae bacterium]|nr:autotransporter-associated beta strand repeat-containing protein [Verrucomicrobiae bacterium]